jgi:hypothetical protein
VGLVISKSRSPSLESQARQVLTEIRAGFAAIIASIHPPVRRPRDLCKTLGLHQTLAWKILRIIEGPDLFADAQYIPGPAGIDAFLQSAAAQGAPPATIQRTRDAFVRYRSLIGVHAGDRASLELMLGGLGADKGPTDYRTLRKAGFRCASATWGVQIRTRLLSKILNPGTAPGMMDVALIRGFIGMRRIRPGAPLTLARVVVLDNDGKARRAAQSQPIEPESAAGGLNYLRPFCSDPLPEIRIAPGPDGNPEHQLGEAAVGEASAATVFSGEVLHSSVSRYRDEHNQFSNTAVVARAPMETVVIDLWSHRDLFPGAAPKALHFGELCGVPWYKQLPGSAEILPLQDRVEVIGTGLDAARLSGVPVYRDLMTHAFTRLGWNPDHFLLYRLKMDYPPIATALVLQVPLPVGPAESHA